MRESFIVVEAQTAATGKPNWAIWHRPEDSAVYSELIARAYSAEWANLIVSSLNGADE